MTAEAVQLIHDLAAPAAALAHLQKTGPGVTDEALEHILDFHLGSEVEALRRFRERDWLWLHAELSRLLARWTEELPVDIAEHRATRLGQEKKAQKILLLRKFVSIIAERIQNH